MNSWRKLIGALVCAWIFILGTSLHAQDIIPPKADTSTPWGISAADNWYRVQETDLTIGTLALERFSQGPNKKWTDLSAFGMLMTHNFDIYVSITRVAPTGPPLNLPERYRATVHLGNSSVGVFMMDDNDGSGGIMNGSIDSNTGLLDWVGTALQFTDKNNSVYTFTPSVSANPTGMGATYEIPFAVTQRIDHINFADGRVRQFYYDSSQRLKLVTDSTGYAILFDYGANNMVSAACGIDLAQSYVTTSSTCSGQAMKVQYGYGTLATQQAGTSAVLTSFTDVLGKTTSYTQTGYYSPMVTCIVPPGYSACKMEITAAGEQTLADGAVWHYGSEGNPFLIGHADPNDYAGASPEFGATVTDPAGKVTTYAFYASSPLSVTDANGNTTTYHWCCSKLFEIDSPDTLDGTLLTEVDFPEGNKYLAAYNGPWNAVTEERVQAKPGSGLSDRVVTYGYTGYTLAKPTSKTDPNGNTTNWTYTSFGEVESEMQPAPTSGAARPLKLYTYVQKSAYIKNSSGTLVSTGQPGWVLSTLTECQTVAGSGNSTPTCDAAAQQTVTTYQYGADGTADNLLVRGQAVASGGVTLRTCYSYDQWSRKISETTPNANLGSCP